MRIRLIVFSSIVVSFVNVIVSIFSCVTRYQYFLLSLYSLSLVSYFLFYFVFRFFCHTCFSHSIMFQRYPSSFYCYCVVSTFTYPKIVKVFCIMKGHGDIFSFCVWYRSFFRYHRMMFILTFSVAQHTSTFTAQNISINRALLCMNSRSNILYRVILV